MLSPLASHSVRASVFVAPLGLWVAMAVVAVLNGILRETLIVPRTGSYPGHVLSTALLVTAILVLTGWFFSWTSVEYSVLELFLVGVGWTVLTVGFEFLVGHLEGTPVSETLAQYDVLAGQVWIVVPLTLLFAPLVFGWVLRG